MDRLGKLEPQCYALLRVMAGVMFAMHGTQKLFGWPGEQQGGAHGLMMLAAIIESLGGLLIAIGLFASPAAFLASGEMAVAFFKAHAPQGSILPILNKGELAVLYCFVFLYIAARGSGAFSIDAGRRRSVR
jgi:putative oxidoreductase